MTSRLLLTILISLVFSCAAESDFSGSTRKKSLEKDLNSDQSGLDADSSDLMQIKFVVGETETKENIDIAWILDESGSMKNENDIVTKNIDAFKNSIAKFSNVKIFNSVEARWEVRSRDALFCVLYAIGVEIVDNSSVRTKCSKAILDRVEKYSALKDFFRKESKKIFVFVTDDNSSLSSDLFLEEMKEFSPKALYYSFAGISKESCASISRPGEVYKELAKSSGAKVFDICTDDWSKELKELSFSIKKKTQNRFRLNMQDGLEVGEVKVNGEVISPESYKTEDGFIELKSDLLEADDEVLVIYKES